MNIIERSRARLGLDSAPIQTLTDILKGEDRHYHGLGHIAYMLDLFEKHGLSWMKEGSRPARLIEAAIWFHDIVYDSQASDNEERSADFASVTLKLADDDDRYLRELIIATKGHSSTEPGCQFLIDLDLAILAAGETRYTAYARGVRAEYAWVPDDAYIDGRTKVLRTFIDRDDLCPILSEKMHGDRYTIRDAARFNMDREIRHLQSAG